MGFHTLSTNTLAAADNPTNTSLIGGNQNYGISVLDIINLDQDTDDLYYYVYFTSSKTLYEQSGGLPDNIPNNIIPHLKINGKQIGYLLYNGNPPITQGGRF